MIKAKTSEVVQNQLPLHHQNKTQFKEFLKAYYEWVEQEGKPADYLQNVVENMDVDSDDPTNMDHRLKQLTKFIPNTSQANKQLLAKHIKEFLSSRGSIESYEFIMNALFGENAKLSNYSDYVFRASASSYIETDKISVIIDGNNDFADAIGCEIVRNDGSGSVGFIEEVELRVHDGVSFNVIKLNEKTLKGEFAPGAQVRALRKTVDRTFAEVLDYFTLVNEDLDNDKIVVNFDGAYTQSMVGKIVKQLGSDFNAKVASLGPSTTKTFTLILSDIDGTLDVGELYLIDEVFVNTHYTKEDYVYGTVDNQLIGIDVIDSGSSYTTGSNIKLIEGSGVGAKPYVNELTRGSVTGVQILRGGRGYQVGDELLVFDRDTGGEGLRAEISRVDGVGEVFNPIMGLDDTAGAIVVVDGGTDYEVDDRFYVEFPSNSKTKPNVYGIFKVATLSNTGGVGTRLVRGFEIQNYGSGYQYMRAVLSVDDGAPTGGSFAAYPYALYNNTIVNETVYATLSKTIATQTKPAGGIIDIELIEAGTAISSTGVATIKINGYGAAMGATIGSGAITAITGTFPSGYNYVDPVITITQPAGSSGSGAILIPTKDGNGRITGATIVSGGSGYTSVTLNVVERYGSGAVIVPLFEEENSSTKGKIQTVTVEEVGTYYNGVPNSFGCVQKGTPLAKEEKQCLVYEKKNGGLGLGRGAKFDLLYKVVDIELISGGKFFNEGNTDVIYSGGKGSGADLQFVIDASVLKSIIIVNGGSGYSSKSVLTVSVSGGSATPPTVTLVLDDEGAIVDYTITSPGSFTTVTSYSISVPGAAPTTTATVTGTGKIVDVAITNQGSGYYDAAEVVPLQITFTNPIHGGDGTYRLYPILNSNGEIGSVEIINPGVGVSADTIGELTIGSTGKIVGAADKVATFTYAVFDGRITKVDVVSSDSGIYYGTNIFVNGNGTGADFTANVNTGIDSAVITFAGDVNAYTANAEYFIPIDPYAPFPGAAKEIGLIMVRTNEKGQASSVHILNPGKGMIDPELDLITYPTAFPVNVGKDPATIVLKANRKIVGVTTNNAGANYEYASLVVRGDGSSARLKPKLDLLGTITSLSNTSSTGYVSKPVITAQDTSGFGAISQIKILDRGRNYLSLPQLTVPTGGVTTITNYSGVGPGDTVINAGTGNRFEQTGHTITGGTFFVSPTGNAITVQPGPGAWTLDAALTKLKLDGQVVAYSNNIGGVKSVAFNDFGVHYEELPIVEFPIPAVVNSTFGILKNEKVVRSDFVDSYIDITPYIEEIKFIGGSDFLITLKSVTDPAVYDPFEYGSCGALDIHKDDAIRFVTGLLTPDNTFNQIVEIINRKQFKVRWVGSTGFPALNTTITPTDVNLSSTHLSPNAIVSSIDYARSLVTLSDASELIVITTESNDAILSEGGTTIQTESSADIAEGVLMTGLTSGAEFRLDRFRRADGNAISGGVGKTAKSFENSFGLLNTITSLLHDSYKIQDFSYLIKTGLSLNSYEDILKQTVHPAGYKMFGEVDIESLVLMPQVRLSEGQANSANEILLQYVLEFVSLYDEYVKDQYVSDLYRTRFIPDNTEINEYNRVMGFDDLLISQFDYLTYPQSTAAIANEATIYKTNKLVNVLGDFFADIDIISILPFGNHLDTLCKPGDWITISGAINPGNNVTARIIHTDPDSLFIYVDASLVDELSADVTLVFKDGNIDPTLGAVDAEYGVPGGYPFNTYDLGYEDVRFESLAYTNTGTTMTITTVEHGDNVSLPLYVGQQVEVIAVTGTNTNAVGYRSVVSAIGTSLILTVPSSADSSGFATIRFNINGRGIE